MRKYASWIVMAVLVVLVVLTSVPLGGVFRSVADWHEGIITGTATIGGIVYSAWLLAHTLVRKMACRLDTRLEKRRGQA